MRLLFKTACRAITFVVGSSLFGTVTEAETGRVCSKSLLALFRERVGDRRWGISKEHGKIRAADAFRVCELSSKESQEYAANEARRGQRGGRFLSRESKRSIFSVGGLW